MLYHSRDPTTEAGQGDAPTTAATAHVVQQLTESSDPAPTAAAALAMPLQQPSSIDPSRTTSAATTSQPVTTPLSVPAKAVSAKLAVAHGEPVLVGKVVSAESGVTRTTRLALPTKNSVNNEDGDDDGDDARSNASASSSVTSSAATSNSFDSDIDKTELLFDFGRYVGQVDPLTGLRDGQGCLHYKSGNVYTGNWRDGAADGFGEKRYKNGDIYRGHWAQGKRSGRGAYLFAQGHFYDGMYVNDQPEGYGIYTTLKGDRYAGHWKAGQKSGKGRETLVNGQVFVGNWRNGKKQGRGKLYLPGAEGYVYGIWNNDKFFRELTAKEMGVDGKEDIVDEFGLPRDASAPPVTPPWIKPSPMGTAVADRVLMGVSALEDRMESLGKALERVMGGSNRDGLAASATSANTEGGNSAASRLVDEAAPPVHLRFASPTRQTAEGILSSDMEVTEYEEEPTVGVELRRPPRATAAAAGSAAATPPAAVLSTADEEDKEKQPVRHAESSTAAVHAVIPAAAAAAEKK